MKWFFHLIDYGSIEERTIPISLGVALERLSKAVRAGTVPGLMKGPDSGVMVGDVFSDALRISRARPLRSNIFKPFFYGRLRRSDGVVTLSGRFRMHPVTTAIVIAFYAALVIITLVFFLIWFGRPPEGTMPAGYVLYGPAFLVLFTAFLYVAHQTSRGDTEWIVDHLMAALQDERH
jgi:hypothetical protein